MNIPMKPLERRMKTRFPMRREVRYRLLQGSTIIASGVGETVDISSGGVAFIADQPVTVGAFIELSVSWPVLLDSNCPMRLVTFGRVLRSQVSLAVCSVDKYEFRTQARTLQAGAGATRNSKMLLRWADGLRKETEKPRTAQAI